MLNESNQSIKMDKNRGKAKVTHISSGKKINAAAAQIEEESKVMP